MGDFQKYKQMNTVQLKRIPELPQIINERVSIHQSKEKSKSFSKRINDLEGNLKLIEKQYKDNLKDGFENKIKAFRLQAVLERKLLKQKIESAKNNLDGQQLRQKIKRTQSIRNRQIEAIKSISARRQQKRKKIRSLIQNEKKQLYEKKKQKLSSLQQVNKQSHNKVCADFRNRHLKKIYMQGIKKQKIKKEESQQKKGYVYCRSQNKNYINQMLKIRRNYLQQYENRDH